MVPGTEIGESRPQSTVSRDRTGAFFPARQQLVKLAYEQFNSSREHIPFPLAAGITFDNGLRFRFGRARTNFKVCNSHLSISNPPIAYLECEHTNIVAGHIGNNVIRRTA